MKIEILGIGEAGSAEGTVVVIDVLRAFSFAAYAFGAGVDRIILMDDLDDARRLAATIPNALAGRDGQPSEGFDLFNSPGQVLERSDLRNRPIVHRTTAGTVGAVAARHASDLFCASFVVADATVRELRAANPETVSFVCSGEGDEDRACAEYMTALLTTPFPNPAPFLRRVEAAGARLREAVGLGYRGVHRDDVDLCKALDRFGFAMRARVEDHHLVLRATVGTDRERWVTGDQVRAAKSRLRASIPGFQQPLAYSLARVDRDGFAFAHVNELGGTHELPAVCLASVCGYASGNATMAMSRAEVAEAINRLDPAEPCAEFEHPNLWSWRPLLAGSPEDATFVAVFIGDLDEPPASDAEVALRALV